MNNSEQVKFKRSNIRYIAGVCGGLADSLNVKPFYLRLFWVVVTIISFILPGLLVYLVLWMVMDPPEKESTENVDK